MLKHNIILKILSITVFLSLFLLIFLGTDLMLKWGIPLAIGSCTAFIITLCLIKCNKDKFVPKIYIVTCLFHFLVAIFIQFLKYKMLHLPTINGFAGVGIDNDGWLYHSQAIAMLENSGSGGLFYSYVVFLIYKIFGVNEFTVCIFNCILSGFIPVSIYLLSKNIILNNIYNKIIAYIIAFSFTVAAYTVVLMRDVYIMLFSYLIILFYFKFQNKYNFKYLLITVIFFVLLCLFRAYAAGAVLGACVVAHFVKLASCRIKNNLVHINKYTFLLIVLVMILLGICIAFNSYLKLDYIISLFDMETILKVSEVGYGGANSSFGVDRVALSHVLPLFLAFGYFCMFFAPFPPQWFLAHNIVQAFSASETIILYIFLIPSFFKGLVGGFKRKNFIIMSASLYILFIFTFYGMILDNSGAVFRGRAPFIPLIYMIAFYNLGGLLKRMVNKYLKLRNGGVHNVA